MSSRHESPHTSSDNEFDTLNITSNAPLSSVPNAFGRIMAASMEALLPSDDATIPVARLRDTCYRPEPVYNRNYNPYTMPPKDLSIEYSPYANGEPLFYDRAIITARLPPRHVITGSRKRLRRAWVWKIGYHLTNQSKASNNGVWACKLCKCFFL
jgi:hypothetical protein